jgi:hypothetical protein
MTFLSKKPFELAYTYIVAAGRVIIPGLIIAGRFFHCLVSARSRQQAAPFKVRIIHIL